MIKRNLASPSSASSPSSSLSSSHPKFVFKERKGETEMYIIMKPLSTFLSDSLLVVLDDLS